MLLKYASIGYGITKRIVNNRNSQARSEFPLKRKQGIKSPSRHPSLQTLQKQTFKISLTAIYTCGRERHTTVFPPCCIYLPNTVASDIFLIRFPTNISIFVLTINIGYFKIKKGKKIFSVSKPHWEPC